MWQWHIWAQHSMTRFPNRAGFKGTHVTHWSLNNNRGAFTLMITFSETCSWMTAIAFFWNLIFSVTLVMVMTQCWNSCKELKMTDVNFVPLKSIWHLPQQQWRWLYFSTYTIFELKRGDLFGQISIKALHKICYCRLVVVVCVWCLY